MKTKFKLLFLYFFYSLNSFGQATLVKEINGYTYKGCPCYMYAFKDNLLYTTGNNELWKTDGTNTVLLKQWKNYIYGNKLTFTNNIIFFEANSGIRQLWKTDGTIDGTISIWDNFIETIPIKVDTNYYFLKYDREIILKNFNNNDFKIILDKSLSNDLYQGNDKELFFGRDAKRTFITKIGDKWLFQATIKVGQNITDFETGLFISDETKLGTKLIYKLVPTNIVENMVTANSKKYGQIAFFVYDDNEHGKELWRSDGTAAGTVLVKDINIGKTNSIFSSYFESILPVEGGVVLEVNKKDYSSELWFSDGSEEGTVKIKDIKSSNSDDINFFKSKVYDKFIYFTIDNKELWRSNGTKEGTFLVLKVPNKFVDAGNPYYTSNYFKETNEYIYALAYSEKNTVDIWKSNRDLGGSLKIGNLTNYGSPPFFEVVGNNFYYISGDDKTGGVWKYPLPTCTISAKINTPNGTSFCTGGSVNIIGEATGTTNTFTYKWKQGTNDLGTATTLAVTKAGTYTLDVTDKSGCTVSASVEVTLTANLPANITGTNNFCAGQSTTLTANVTGGVSPFTYQWKNNTTNVGTNTNTLLASTGGAYNVSITDSKGCTGTSTNYTVTQNPSPNVAITKSGATDLLVGGSVVLSVPSATNQTYQWLKDNIAISGATNNSYTATGAGKFSVTVTSNGCSATSEAITVSVVLANELPSESKNFKVSPNPFENSIKINFNEPLIKIAKLNLINSFGSIVKEWVTNQQDNVFDILGLPSGIYILKCERNDKIEVIKLVKN